MLMQDLNAQLAYVTQGKDEGNPTPNFKFGIFGHFASLRISLNSHASGSRFVPWMLRESGYSRLRSCSGPLCRSVLIEPCQSLPEMTEVVTHTLVAVLSAGDCQISSCQELMHGLFQSSSGAESHSMARTWCDFTPAASSSCRICHGLSSLLLVVSCVQLATVLCYAKALSIPAAPSLSPRAVEFGAHGARALCILSRAALRHPAVSGQPGLLSLALSGSSDSGMHVTQ